MVGFVCVPVSAVLELSGAIIVIILMLMPAYLNRLTTSYGMPALLWSYGYIHGGGYPWCCIMARSSE